MKEAFFKFCEKYLIGGLHIKISKTRQLNTSRLGVIATVAILMIALGYDNGIKVIEYTGYVLLPVIAFGYLYYNLFPSRRPKEK